MSRISLGRAPLRAAALAAVILAGLPLAAAGPARADVGAVLKCRDIADPAERLACFDRTVPALAAPGAAAPAAPGPTPLERFGAERLPQAVQEQTRKETGELDYIAARVTAVRQGSPGRYTLALDNGQTWSTLEAMRAPPKTGEAVVIERGMISSYNLLVAGRNAITKVRRVQ